MSARVSEILPRIQLVAGGGKFSCRDCGVALPAGGTICESCITEHRRRDREQAERVAAARREEWLSVIGVPARFREAKFSTLAKTPAVVAVRKFYGAGAWKRGRTARALGLYGPTGVGKTTAAAAAANALLTDLRTHQRFMLTAALGRRLLGYHQVDEAMHEATTTSLLILDDVNPEAEPRVLALVEEVLITREAEGRALIYTTNATPTRLAEAFSDRVVDRLLSWCDVAMCTGPSLRRPPESAA